MGNYLLLSNRNQTKLKEFMPSDNALERTANYFQNFSDGTRLKIINCLSVCDMCVNDLSKILNINQTTISHQLKILKSQNIVTFRRDGKIIVYSLCDKKFNDIMFLAVC